MTRAQLDRVSRILLVLGTFFNPLGFDALWALVQAACGSYWLTSVLFYLAAGLCFALHFLIRQRLKRSAQE